MLTNRSNIVKQVRTGYFLQKKTIDASSEKSLIYFGKFKSKASSNWIQSYICSWPGEANQIHYWPIELNCRHLCSRKQIIFRNYSSKSVSCGTSLGIRMSTIANTYELTCHRHKTTLQNYHSDRGTVRIFQARLFIRLGLEPPHGAKAVELFMGIAETFPWSFSHGRHPFY